MHRLQSESLWAYREEGELHITESLLHQTVQGNAADHTPSNQTPQTSDTPKCGRI